MNNVLMIAPIYPPRNSIGALRTAKFAKYLPMYGWKPFVLTRDWERDCGGLEEPAGIQVVRTHFRDMLAFFRGERCGEQSRMPRFSQFRSRWKNSNVRRLASFWLKELVDYPDEFIGWRPFAIKAARDIIREENIRLIYSTSSPATSHLIARAIKRETGLPWVADLRDLWSQNHYNHHVILRRRLETSLEKRVLMDSDVLVTVSLPLAEKLRELHNKQVEIITNGFDEDDYPDPPVPLTPYFSLTYTGQIYNGKRDPSLLFAAAKELFDAGEIDPELFKMRFYGPDEEIVRRLAEKYGVNNLVQTIAKVSYYEAIRRQQESMILLLLNWRSPAEKGVYTGKLFEYLGARRPILAIPKNYGVVDELLNETNAGLVVNTKEDLVNILHKWILSYRQCGNVPYCGNDNIIKRYTRRNQAKRLAEIFNQSLN